MQSITRRVVGLGIVAAFVAGYAVHAVAQSRRPWDDPYTPTVMEWIVLTSQVTHNDENIDDGIFYGYHGSFDEGTLEVLFMYDKTATAENMDKADKMIEFYMETLCKRYPWLKLKVKKHLMD